MKTEGKRPVITECYGNSDRRVLFGEIFQQNNLKWCSGNDFLSLDMRDVNYLAIYFDDKDFAWMSYSDMLDYMRTYIQRRFK